MQLASTRRGCTWAGTLAGSAAQWPAGAACHLPLCVSRLAGRKYAIAAAEAVATRQSRATRQPSPAAQSRASFPLSERCDAVAACLAGGFAAAGHAAAAVALPPGPPASAPTGAAPDLLRDQRHALRAQHHVRQRHDPSRSAEPGDHPPDARHAGDALAAGPAGRGRRARRRAAPSPAGSGATWGSCRERPSQRPAAALQAWSSRAT
jgi:hypothetical protein